MKDYILEVITTFISNFLYSFIAICVGLIVALVYINGLSLIVPLLKITFLTWLIAKSVDSIYFLFFKLLKRKNK